MSNNRLPVVIKKGAFGRTRDRFGPAVKSQITPDATTSTHVVDPLRNHLERWISGGPPDQHTIRWVRTRDGELVLERRGGPPPAGWKILIDPTTFDPVWVPPVCGEIHKDIEKQGSQMEPNKPNVSSKNQSGNWFQRDRYVTWAHIRDLTKIPRFCIDTPTFKFDSHAENPGWFLSCKQRHFNGKPGKLVLKLVHEDHDVQSTVTIRPSGHNLHCVVKNEDDLIELFQHDFRLETNVIARQVHRPLSAYSDDELLAELKNRSDARLDGWKPRRRIVNLANVVNLDEIRQNLPVLDEEKLARILAA